MKPTPSRPMKAKGGRVTSTALEQALERLGLVLDTKGRDALFHLAEASEIFETIQNCLEAITNADRATPTDRLHAVSQVSQWLTDVQVDLYDHLQPMHLRPLRSRLSSLIDAVCRLEERLEKE